MPDKDNLYHEFAVLLQQHERLVYKVCSLYTDDTEDRKDLFQEIVLQAWMSYPRFNHEAKVSTWLYRVALNTAISHKRKQKKHIVAGNDTMLQQLEDQKDASYAEEYKMMHRMINELPRLDKALVLLYLEDNSYQEIAEILGISASNVGTRLNRIKEKMKRQAEMLAK
jgi:RNA polymerase sigma factor (sigma-70 family)